MPAPPLFHSLLFLFADTAPLPHFVPGVTTSDIARLWSEMAETQDAEPQGAAVSFVSLRRNGRQTRDWQQHRRLQMVRRLAPPKGSR